MPDTKRANNESPPADFEALVRRMPPRAIRDEVAYENTLEMIDGLMASGDLTEGQASYLETLVELVEAYEARVEAIDVSEITGIDCLKHLLAENGMSASDLARLLGVHPSMGSKILKGDRSLTVAHIETLSRHFKVNPSLFIAPSA